MRNLKSKLLSLCVLCLIVSAALLGSAGTGGLYAAGQGSAIVNQTALGEITGPNGAEWDRGDLETRNVSPLASSGKSIEFKNAAGWFNLERTLGTAIDAVAELDVSYDSEAKTSDMGIAFWLYVGDETTMEAAKSMDLKMWIGPDSGNTWHESVTVTGLLTGWNELVLKHNAAWFAAGSPSSVSAIKYVKIVMENLGENPKVMAINNLRLVKTSLGSGVAINAHEAPGYDAADSVAFKDANQAGLAYYPEGAQLSDNVPEGMTGQSVKLSARTSHEKVFGSAFDAIAAGKAWLSQSEINAWQSAASISLWLYIPDVVEYKDAMANAAGSEYAAIVFSSSGSAVNSVSVSLKDNYAMLREGWNQIVLRLFNGTLDTAGINYFGIYNNMGIEQQLEVYGVCVARSNIIQQGAVINDNTTGAAFPNSSHSIELTDGSTADGWTNVSGTEAVSAGSLTSAVVAQVPSTYTAYTAAGLDTADWTADYITVTAWIYTNNPAKLKNTFNYIYLAESQAQYDADNYYEYALTGLQFVKGWNKVRLSVAENYLNGTVDALNIKYLRFELPSAADSKIALSEISMYESSNKDKLALVSKIMEVDDAPPNLENKNTLSATDSIDYWDQYAFGIMPYGAEDGQTSVYMRSESGVMQTRLRAAPLDISGYNFSHTVLTFWFYINDSDLMSDKDAQIELGSGLLEDDSNEFGWDFKLSSLPGLESGKWHKLALRIIPQGLTDSNEKGMVNLSEIRFFRMYWLDTANEGESAKALISTLTIEEMDVSGFDGDTVILEKRDFTQGYTPGEIDEYDMTESADGTFPQTRPGEEEPGGDEEPGDGDNGGGGKKPACGSATAAQAAAAVGAAALIVVAIKKRTRKMLR